LLPDVQSVPLSRLVAHTPVYISHCAWKGPYQLYFEQLQCLSGEHWPWFHSHLCFPWTDDHSSVSAVKVFIWV